KMQVFAYSTATGKVLWKFEETCTPGTRGPGLVTGSGLPITFNKEDCVVIHGNRQWKILRQADGKQVWSWECSGPNEAPAWASGELKWSQPGFRMGLSLAAAEGRVYVRSHQTVTLVEANPNAYVEKGKIEKVHDVKNTGARSHQGLLDWNMPVIARGRMYIRT